jgi:N6-L-threonylcarbamoyladenine synthase
MIILGIESSCDETAAALLEVDNNNFSVLSSVVRSQLDIHQVFGGVVPEVAARAHVESIIAVINEALTGKKPDLISVTKGPGLITSLLVGTQTAKTLSYLWQKPLVGVNHLVAHCLSPLLTQKIAWQNKKILCLVVSGGHTELVLTDDLINFKLIGSTRDDAIGEAYDKVAKLLDLGYPGGPVVSQQAQAGFMDKYKLPLPMVDSNNYDWSYSGLKTAVKYLLKELKDSGKLNEQAKKDICASFEHAAIEVIYKKVKKAVLDFAPDLLLVGGGVSANAYLRQKLTDVNLSLPVFFPEPQYTGDNAAMVALAGWFARQKAGIDNWQTLAPAPNLRFVD